MYFSFACVALFSVIQRCSKCREKNDAHANERFIPAGLLVRGQTLATGLYAALHAPVNGRMGTSLPDAGHESQLSFRLPLQ
jgi:hypothetical protein